MLFVGCWCVVVRCLLFVNHCLLLCGVEGARCLSCVVFCC